jgi:hypothetical protein
VCVDSWLSDNSICWHNELLVDLFSNMILCVTNKLIILAFLCF